MTLSTLSTLLKLVLWGHIENRHVSRLKRSSRKLRRLTLERLRLYSRTLAVRKLLRLLTLERSRLFDRVIMVLMLLEIFTRLTLFRWMNTWLFLVCYEDHALALPA